MLTRFRLLLVAAVLLLPQWSMPALAGAVIRADFDGDGVLDTATVSRGARPVVEITVSRTVRVLRVPLRERPLSLVAADLDHDGRVDLAGLSPRSGLLLLRNGGGRFTAVHRLNGHRRAGSHGIVARGRGALGAPLPTSGETSSEDVRSDDHLDSAVEARAGPGSSCWTPLARPSVPLVSSARRHRAPSRAPPL